MHNICSVQHQQHNHKLAICNRADVGYVLHRLSPIKVECKFYFSEGKFTYKFTRNITTAVGTMGCTGVDGCSAAVCSSFLLRWTKKASLSLADTL